MINYSVGTYLKYNNGSMARIVAYDAKEKFYLVEMYNESDNFIGGLAIHESYIQDNVSEVIIPRKIA